MTLADRFFVITIVAALGGALGAAFINVLALLGIAIIGYRRGGAAEGR